MKIANSEARSMKTGYQDENIVDKKIINYFRVIDRR